MAKSSKDSNLGMDDEKSSGSYNIGHITVDSGDVEEESSSNFTDYEEIDEEEDDAAGNKAKIYNKISPTDFKGNPKQSDDFLDMAKADSDDWPYDG